MSKGKFALGALFGAAAGAVAALLTAPKSGKETRQDLKKKADDMKKIAADKKKELEGQAKDLKSRAENAVQGAKDGFNKSDSK